jgi:hypothetical protein
MQSLLKPAWALTPEEYREIGDQYDHSLESHFDDRFTQHIVSNKDWSEEDNTGFDQTSLAMNASRSIDTFKEETAGLVSRRNAFLFEVDNAQKNDESRYDLNPGGTLISASKSTVSSENHQTVPNSKEIGEPFCTFSKKRLLQIIARKIKDLQRNQE